MDIGPNCIIGQLTFRTEPAVQSTCRSCNEAIIRLDPRFVAGGGGRHKFDTTGPGKILQQHDWSTVVEEAQDALLAVQKFVEFFGEESVLRLLDRTRLRLTPSPDTLSLIIWTSIIERNMLRETFP